MANLAQSYPWPSAGNKHDKRQYQTDHKEYPRDICRDAGNSGHAEYAGDKRDNEKHKCEL
jgi:hypothetical protein